jgi:hypothetical protein
MNAVRDCRDILSLIGHAVQSSSSLRPGAVLHCDKADSVLAAVEKSWSEHRASSGAQMGFYTYLAQLLSDKGIIIDACDGLDLLEHCRRHQLQIVDILHTLDAHVRRAGYDGGPLSVADYQIGAQPVYVFYDSKRFRNFADVKIQAADRAPRLFREVNG